MDAQSHPFPLPRKFPPFLLETPPVPSTLGCRRDHFRCGSCGLATTGPPTRSPLHLHGWQSACPPPPPESGAAAVLQHGHIAFCRVPGHPNSYKAEVVSILLSSTLSPPNSTLRVGRVGHPMILAVAQSMWWGGGSLIVVAFVVVTVVVVVAMVVVVVVLVFVVIIVVVCL